MPDTAAMQDNPVVPDEAVISDTATVPPAKPTLWCTRDVGYFVPNNTDQRHHYCADGVTYFTNVYAFVNHLRSLQSHMSMATIRGSIHSCLRGKALDWHAVELSAKARTDLRALPLEEGWYKRLTERFQVRESMAFYQFETSSYGLKDIKARRDPVEWAHNMLRHAQRIANSDPGTFREDAQRLGNTGTGTYNQLEHLFHAIDDNLGWPDACIQGNTSVADFTEDLDDLYLHHCMG